mgnify:FL=1
MILFVLTILVSMPSWGQNPSGLTDKDRFKLQNMDVSIRKLEDGQFNKDISVKRDAAVTGTMTISGRLGIGTTSPLSTFDIQSSSNAFSVNVDTFTIMDGNISAPSQPALVAAINAAQVAPNAQYTRLLWNTGASNTWSRGGMLSGGSSTATVRVNGLYFIGCQARFPADADGVRYLQISKNDVGIGFQSEPTNSGTYDTLINFSTLSQCVSGDILSCEVYHDAGGNLTISAGLINTHFEVIKLW